MNAYRTALTATMMLTVWTSLALGQQKAEKSPDSKSTTQSGRICTQEHGVNVCRDAGATQGGAATAMKAKQRTEDLVGVPMFPGKLLLMLDIPSNIFARLAENPEKNREYRPTRVREYRPTPPVPPGAGEYSPPTGNQPPAWSYHPKKSFAYHPKQNWTYNRDVYGRLWRQNIAHDTRVVEIPYAKRGTYLLPVGAAQ